MRPKTFGSFGSGSGPALSFSLEGKDADLCGTLVFGLYGHAHLQGGVTRRGVMPVGSVLVQPEPLWFDCGA